MQEGGMQAEEPNFVLVIFDVFEHHAEEIIDAAGLEGQAAIHVGFADAHPGIAGDGADGLPIGDVDGGARRTA
jgi:hypothetical protein